MQRFVNVPLIFLFIGSLLGIFLRWQFIAPTSGINYTYFLHGHSHIMFLGWVFNALFIGFTLNHIGKSQQQPFRILFIVLQVLVLGMMVSFPLQGYGFFSILFSTLHTFVAIAFVVMFFNRTKHVTSASAWYARLALVFFMMSTAGPFSLGYLMSSGLGQSQWYYFSIYFYLHFQYNGFFLFGIFSLFFNLFEKRQISFSIARAKSPGVLLAIACVPAYLLSTLWAKPGFTYNLIAALAAMIQMFGLIMLFRLIGAKAKEIKRNFHPSSVFFLLIVLISFTAKMILQLASAWPTVAQMAYELRPVTIAYLHLVLLGVISLFLLVWFLESNFLDRSSGRNGMRLFLPSFLGMEVCLVLYPWWSKVFGTTFPSASLLTFLFSALLSASCFLIVIAAHRAKT